MNLQRPILVSFVFALSLSLSTSLRILFVMPCQGGHFGSMVPMIMSLSSSNDVTVLETSTSCQPKLAPYLQKAPFRVIEEDFVEEVPQLKGFLNLLWAIIVTGSTMAEKTFIAMNIFFEANKNNYDVVVMDMTMEGELIAAEVADLPTAVINTGMPGPVEELVDKMGFPFLEIIAIKLVMKSSRDNLIAMRRNQGLPDFVPSGDFTFVEYGARFPAMIVTSPDFYPEAHPSASFIYIGANQNASIHAELDEELQNWLDQKDKTVIYLSLGTLFTLSDNAIQEFVSKTRSQNEYSFVWSMSKDLESAVKRLELSSDSRLYLSGYLPQYTLLGHKKVKVFVTHGGLGSTIDLIKQRKPAVCSPQLFDQFYNCRKLESLKIAEYCAAFDFESIIESVTKVIENYDAYATNADVMAQNLARYESKEAIEEFLNKVASKGSIDVIKEFKFNFCSEKCYTAWMIFVICVYAGLTFLLILCFLAIKWCVRQCKNKNRKVKQT